MRDLDRAARAAIRNGDLRASLGDYAFRHLERSGNPNPVPAPASFRDAFPDTKGTATWTAASVRETMGSMMLARRARLPFSMHSLLVVSLLPLLAAPPSARGAAREDKRAKPPVLTPDEVKQRKEAASALLGRWLAVQNQGDFGSYMALYAPRFHGIRRSRLQTVRLDRAGWAKDRGKMFVKPMKVETADVEILPGKTMIKVLFTQRWSSGSYSDVGPKRILLSEVEGKWLIAEEQMLASHAPSATEMAPATIAGQFAPVFGGQVLLAKVDGLCDGASTIETSDFSEGERIECPVKAVSVHRDLAAWKSERITLFGKDGEGCTTRIMSFAMVGRAYLMPGLEEEEAGGEEISESAHRKTVWAHSAPLLVGKVSGCENGEYVWARFASLPKPARARIAELPDNLGRATTGAFHALPGWSTAQRECSEGGKPWEDRASSERLLISARVGSATQRLVSVSASTGDCADGCADLYGLWSLAGSGANATFTTLLTDGSTRDLWAAFDSDGDGRLEFLFREFSDSNTELVLWVPGAQGSLVPGPRLVLHRWHGCGC